MHPVRRFEEQLSNIAKSGLGTLTEYGTYTVSGHQILPIRSAMNVEPGQQIQISARPQRVQFVPDRFIIRDRGSSGFDSGAGWVVHDLRIGGVSYLTAPVAAEAFVDAFLSLGTIEIAQDLTLIVEYIGDDPAGRPFDALLVGRGPEGTDTYIKLDGVIYVLEERRGWMAAIRTLEEAPSALRRIDPPRVISLRVVMLRSRPMLLGIDEQSGHVVFEMSYGALRFDLGGYVPDWWEELREIG